MVRRPSVTWLGSRSGTPAAFVAISAVTSATTVTSRHAAAPRQAGALAPRSGAWKRGRSGIGSNTVAARALVTRWVRSKA